MNLNENLIELELEHELELDNIKLKKGTKLNALQLNENNYKIFHFTGCWEVEKKYFK